MSSDPEHFPHTSGRERALEALKCVLEKIPGIEHVDRQAMAFDMVSDDRLPAILIVEGATNYTWRRRKERVSKTQDTLTLDVQLRAPKQKQGLWHQASTYREALVYRILSELANNPQLECQLEGEQASTCHVDDVLDDGERQAPFARVSYIQEPPPYARALITLTPKYLESVGTSPTSQVTWESLILEWMSSLEDEAASLETDPIDLTPPA